VEDDAILLSHKPQATGHKRQATSHRPQGLLDNGMRGPAPSRFRQIPPFVGMTKWGFSGITRRMRCGPCLTAKDAMKARRAQRGATPRFVILTNGERKDLAFIDAAH